MWTTEGGRVARLYKPLVALAGVTVLVVAGSVWAAMNPSSFNQALMVVEAYEKLGPHGANICLSHDQQYAYDPRREHADGALVRDHPEDAAAAYVRDNVPGSTSEAESVEVDMGRGSSRVQMRVQQPEGVASMWELSLWPRGAQIVSVDLPQAELMICTAEYQGWFVVDHRVVDGT
jgi:hypothetical protein